MKFKYKLKLYDKKLTKNKKNKIFGNLIIKNCIFNVYLIKNNYIKKILKSNFLVVNFFEKIYFTYIKFIKFKYIKNEIEFFIIEEIKKNFFLNYKNDKIKINKKINFINNNFFPRSIYLNVKFNKKKIKECDYSLINFNLNKKILFLNKI